MGLRARAVRGACGDPAWVLDDAEPIPLGRRRGDRRPLPEGVRVTEPDLGVAFEAFDLRDDGIFLHAELLFSVGDRLNLVLARGTDPGVAVEGEVVDVWAEADPDRGGAGAGVQVAFGDLSIADREALLSLAAR